MVSNTLRALLCSTTVAFSVLGQEIKVDFNASGRPLSETWDTAYTPWSTNQSWFTGGDVISSTFNRVTFTFRRVGPTGTSLTTDRYSAGLTTPGWAAKLVNDGITVAPLHINNIAGGAEPGARIELTISGLAPGPHSLLAWHNTWQNPANYTFSPLNVYLNGVMRLTNFPVSNRVTNNADAAYSYLEFVSDGINNTVITYEASTVFTVTDANPCIDGFELDTPNFKYKANRPYPANGDEHVDADGTRSVLLSWTKAAIAVSHNVYFGASSNAVKNATTASPEFKGNQAGATLLITNLSSLVTNYWRIDEIDATNGVTKGELWTFRTRHLAFPGAEGYGRFARGGRGGVVVKVTNLDNSGPGSFRDAIEGNYGPRTVVFDVGGLITLESDLIIGGSRPCITVVGQTAPGKGICIRKHQFGMSGAHDIICRFVRVRVGDISGETQNGSGMAGVDHSIMDHCSISWGIDEEMSTRGANNLTLQKTLISEALNIAGHDKYPPGTRHGYAASIGGDVASFHHNLLAHCEGRNWSLAGGLDANGYFAGRLDIFNNVVYNWGGRTTDGGAHEANFVNNYYKPGPAINRTKILTAEYENFPGTQRYYFVGNVMPGYYQTNQQDSARTYTGTPQGYSPWTNAPFFLSHAAIDEVTNAYKKVLSDVGCNQPQVDDHDARVIHETLNGSCTFTGSVSGAPGLPDSQNDVGGWELYPTVFRPTEWDTDNDGLPNWWETIKGLNTNSPAGDFTDSNGDPDGDEYTNLEDYLNWMAEPHTDCNVGSFVDVDLAALTRGFTNDSPAYTLSAPVAGTVTLVDGKVARFTPTATRNALGCFNFSVLDAQGYNMTSSIGIRIIETVEPAQPPVLGIRPQNGTLLLELNGEAGRALTVQTNTNLNGDWLDWTNVTGSGVLQLPSLQQLTNQPPCYFRAYAR